MKIVIVTQDVGPGHSLRIVGDKLRELGHQVESFLGGGKALPEGSLVKIGQALKGADRLLIGISSTPERCVEERFASNMASYKKVPVAIFSDTAGTYHKPWAQDFVCHTDTLFVIDQSEVETARKYVNDKTNIVVTGAAPYWQTFFDKSMSKEEVRQKMGMHPGEKMVLAVGSKERDRNSALYSDLILASNRIDQEMQLALTLHPGADHTASAYDSILKLSKNPVGFAGRDLGLSSQNLILGTDLVISPISTVGIMAACQRIPVIDLIHEVDRTWWMDQSGLDFWPPAKAGTSITAHSVDGLEVAMRNVFAMSISAQRMFNAQRRDFSPQKFEGATNIMVEALTS